MIIMARNVSQVPSSWRVCVLVFLSCQDNQGQMTWQTPWVFSHDFLTDSCTRYISLNIVILRNSDINIFDSIKILSEMSFLKGFWAFCI